VFTAPVQAGASTNLPAPIVTKVPTPVQAGVGTRFVLEEAAASFQLPASTAGEVFGAPLQAGASTEFILEEATASFQLPVLTANEVFAPVVQMGSSTDLLASIANQVPTPLQAGVCTKFILEEAAASFQLPAVFAAPVQAGASTEFILEEVAASFQLPAATAHEVFAAPL
jgi:hypothetical protein